MFRRIFIRLNNAITVRRRIRVPAPHLLLLVPHCLQRSACKRKLIPDVDQCARCGECDIRAILQIRDELGFRCHLAAGGRQALERVRDPQVRAVVAVACEKELVEGIRMAFPTPVYAVVNERPKGPCHDTTVDLDRLRAVIGSMLCPPESAGTPPAGAAGKDGR